MAMLTTTVLSLSSCDAQPEIYVLLANILQNKTDGTYFFDAGINIKINEDYLSEAMPEELNFKISGMVSGSQGHMSAVLVQDEEEDIDLKTTVYKQGNAMWFELGDFTGIILDLLCTAGLIDLPVKVLFDSETEGGDDNAAVLYFDLIDFDLSFFDEYIKDINKIFTIKSNVTYDFTEDVDIPEYERLPGLNFSDIKTNISKELLKLPYYRYSDLFIVLETDEEKNNFMHVLAARENGITEILTEFKLDCDLVNVRENPELLYNENILPMRYILELLGETVNWEDEAKRAFTVHNGRNIYYDGSLINSRTYISLGHILVNTDYILNSVVSDEYIEIKITRR